MISINNQHCIIQGAARVYMGTLFNEELQIKLKEWLAKQSLGVESAVVTAIRAARGDAIDFSSIMPPTPPNATLNPQAMALSGGPLVQARNFALMTGVNAGITCVMRIVRGKEDVLSSMTVALCSGAMFSLVRAMGGPNLAANAVKSGMFFALIRDGLFKLWDKFSKPLVEDVLYDGTRSMLSSLGLQNYEKNFKKGLLTDSTLPLLTDSALRDVGIPPGPRLLILNRIKSDPALKGKRRSSVEVAKTHVIQ